MEPTVEETKDKGWRRVLRVVGRVTVTLGVVAGAALAVQFGSSEIASRADAAPQPEAAPLIPVQTRAITVETGYRIERAFVGQVEAQRTAELSFELPGRVDALHVDEGDAVTAGMRLATQDTSLLEAERQRLIASRTATQAQLRFAEQTVTRNSSLKDSGFASQARLDEALARQGELTARIAEIDAALSDIDIRMSKAHIRAPFDGRITERRADGGEMLGGGQAVFGLVALDAPQLRVGVTLDLGPEDLAQSRIEIDGTRYPTRFITLRPDIDPVTRTRTALFELTGQAPVSFGQTAQLIVERQVEAPGIWVPTTSLKEGVRGQWTVLSVDAERTVRAAPVEVLHAESDRVFVRTALPEGALLIETGPQRVTIGQQVTLAAR